jgi:large subunit ribosomal protein L21
MFAVIKTGGKQYKVAANDVLKIEKLEAEPGTIVTFDQVLMVGEGDAVTVGAPLVEGAMVAAEFVGTKKQKTIIILKKHRRQHYDRRNGHRQLLSSVRITEILTGGAQPTIEPRARTAAAPSADVSDAAPTKRARKGKADTAPEAQITETEPVTHVDVATSAELPAAEEAKPVKRGAAKKTATASDDTTPATEGEDKPKKAAAPRKSKPKAEDQE